jgi:hypothetical protein
VRFAAHPTLPIVAVFSYFHRELQLRNLDTGDVVCQELPPWRDGNNSAWHPSGDYLCICEADGTQIRVYRFDAADQLLKYERSMACAHGDTRLTFTASGEHFFATGWAPTVSVWDFWTARQVFQTRASSRSRVLATVDSRVALAGVPDQADQLGTWLFSVAREYRPVVPYLAADAKHAGDFALHPRGRIAAQHFPDGIRGE